MTIISQIDQILENKPLTDDDLVTLSKLNYQLSKLYDQYIVVSSSVEEQYNLARGEYYTAIKKKYKGEGKRITDSEADRYAKDRAEKEYGNYRSAMAKARGMMAQIHTVEQIIITANSAQKRSITGDYSHDTFISLEQISQTI